VLLVLCVNLPCSYHWLLYFICVYFHVYRYTILSVHVYTLVCVYAFLLSMCTGVFDMCVLPIFVCVFFLI
jgi:hypothetical protein